MIKAILFDFGGVIAEEGFKNGLQAIARKQGLDPDRFFSTAQDLVYSTGYVLGQADELAYWEAIRKETDLKIGDAQLRKEVLNRFIVRSAMIDVVQDLKKKGFLVGILSDQSNWLEELDQKYDFLRHFDRVFNSFHLHKSKKDPSLFMEVCTLLGVDPREVLFIDDNLANIERAASRGLKTIHFRDVAVFKEDLNKILPSAPFCGI
jgi:putative hydrolase of the HAD superfamily